MLLATTPPSIADWQMLTNPGAAAPNPEPEENIISL
jgi:hypothetical protein